MPQTESFNDEGWSYAKRIGFRFAFSYLALYLFLCRFIESDLNLETGFGFAPGGKFVAAAYAKTWAPVVVWTGKHILHLSRRLAYSPDGNADGIFGYVQLVCFALIAVIATIVWTLADRKSTGYRQLYAWLRIVLRYALAFSMLSYGMIKVIPIQFPAPSLIDLLTPHGDYSPFWLLWTFMGYSTAYTIFSGAAEVLAGALLLFRRTTSLGALVAFAVLLNVGMLDFCYDVPEKLDVIFLLLMAIILLAPDLGRLANVLVLNRPTSPAMVPIPPASRRMRIARVGAKALVITYMIVTTVMAPQKIKAFYSPHSPLYGIYDVDEFTRNGELLPPLTTDATRWRKVVFLTTDETYVEQMDDSWNDLDTSYDNAAKKVTLVFKSGKTTNKSAFAYSQPDRDHMVLNGSLGNDSITVKLKRFDESKFDLVKSKFRWINGFP
jgi:multidrug transporter EmrE-like cation transporter